MWVALIQSIEGLNRTKDSKREFALFACLQAGTLVFSCHWTCTETYTMGSPGFQAFGPKLELISLVLLGLQIADYRSWDFSASKILWANSS